MAQPTSLSPDAEDQALSPEETAAVLRRIVLAVETASRHRWMEITSAIVLSLATTASAWCAYQATLWGGVQTFQLDAANDAHRRSSLAGFSAMQARMFDATTLISYLEAKSRGDAAMENVLYRRFRPSAKKAIDAWLATDPLTNSAAPINPFDSPDYVQPELEEARRQEDLALKYHATAQNASQHSDHYVLLTVLFASVLFFGGIGGTFESVPLRLAVLGLALVLLTATLVAMLLMPVTAG
jgi:hypothetical protein